MSTHDSADEPPPDPLVVLCELTRWSHRASTASVAVITDESLEFVASSAVGPDEIVGARLRSGQGRAGFVAATGHSVAVREAMADPRFARDVAERSGYVPDAIQIKPIRGGDGQVVGVISVLDGGGYADASAYPPMSLSGFADLAAALLRNERRSGLDRVSDRIRRLGADDREAALTAISSVLDAFER